jgi:hypothetical protein
MKKLLSMTTAVAVALSAAAPAVPQTPRSGQKVEQKVTPPEARYWMGAVTGGGLMAMTSMANDGNVGIGDAMRMATGGVSTEGRTVELRLGSSLAPTKGEAAATHTMPRDAQVNKPIQLITPTPTSAQGESGPAEFKQPKGQITFYWGCHEKAPKGQPVILTFDKLLRGENDPELNALNASVDAREVRKPTYSSSKTYGEWPHPDPKNKNRGLKMSFPAGASLAGQHVVEGNYSPKLDFTLPGDKTFMGAVTYTSSAPTAAGALNLTWAPLARATGYSLGVMAPEKLNDDTANIIMWSSADRPATFIQMEDLLPAEVQRLIGLKAVLPPEKTSCMVPAEVVKATKEGSMLMFTAFGDQATFVYPPRPDDPAVTWDQEWFARVTFRSDRMDMISPQGVQDMSAMMSGAMASAGGAQPAAMSDAEYCQMLYTQQRSKPSVAEMAGSASGIPGGGLLGRAMSGRGKKDEEAVRADPRCTTFKAK